MMRSRLTIAAGVVIAAAMLSAGAGRAIEFNLSDLKPLWNGSKWLDKDGNDITKLVEDASKAHPVGAPDAGRIGAPSGAPVYEQPHDVLDAAGVSPHDLPDVPNQRPLPDIPKEGPASNLQAYSPPQEPVKYEKLPPDYHTPEPPPKNEYTKVPPEQPKYGKLPPEDPKYGKLPPEDPKYGKLPPEKPKLNYAELPAETNVKDPPEKPSFFKRNRGAIIKGSLMIGTIGVLIGTSVTVDQLVANGTIQ